MDTVNHGAALVAVSISDAAGSPKTADRCGGLVKGPR